VTTNNRPIEDPRLQKALDDCRKVFARYGYAGAVMIISPDEAAFFYAMHAPWSAIRFDPDTPLGWRIQAKEAEDGRAATEVRVEAAVHTIMTQVKALLRQAGK
jgi:hypothetical protein